MPKPVSEQVVVITGASSGIGREAALRFAREGASVVLTARNAEALRTVENEITAEGGRVVAMPADVADFAQMQRVAQGAIERFGRIDTWVNNAAVTTYGNFEDIPPDEFKRVLDVNVMGQVHGAKAALPHLKASRGTLIGIGSVNSEVPMPLQTAYVASEHALKGFYDTLRLEQRHVKSGVQVNLLMFDSVNTPLFEHSMTHLGVMPGPVPPVYDPSLVANAIVQAAQNPVGDAMVTTTSSAWSMMHRLAPGYVDAAFERMGYREQVTSESKPPSGPNNLWQPMPGPGAVQGPFRATPFDPVTWLRERPAVRNVVAGVVLAAVAFPLAGFLLRGLACNMDID